MADPKPVRRPKVDEPIEQKAWIDAMRSTGKPVGPQTGGVDKFAALARELFTKTNPGNWGAINELLSTRLKGESESAAKIKGQILQGEMARALAMRIAHNRGSAALAAARSQSMAPRAAELVGQAAIARRDEQAQAANTFAIAAQKQEALRADFLKMGLTDAQSEMAAKTAMDREMQLRKFAKRALSNAETTALMNKIGALHQMVGVASTMYGSMPNQKAGGGQTVGGGGGYTDYMTKEAEKDIFDYPETQIEDTDQPNYGYDWEWA